MDMDWWRGAVIYQIYPRSFQDSDGDGIGDLRGIIDRLPHVAGLGVDAIWLSPIFTSPMKDMGYDIADYKDIDPSFGTLADFDALVARAHELGLKVMIDQVISHSSDRHPLFAESRASREGPKADWYVWADPKPDGTPPTNWQSLFGGPAWTWDARRRQYYLHNFLSSQPDLNFHNTEVQDYMLDVLRFWLERGVDGFRLDVVNFYFHDPELRDNPVDFRPKTQPDIRPFDMQYAIYQKTRPENLAFLQRLRALMDEYDARTTVGEVGELHHPIETMAAYTSDRRLHMAYSFEMLGPNFTPAHFRHQIDEFFRIAPEGWPCWAFSNHDVIRHVSRWAQPGDDLQALAKLCAALLLSLPGSVCLYQGEELGQLETLLARDEIVDPQGIAFWPDEKGRDGCRTPMTWQADAPNGGFSTAPRPWLPVKPAQLAQAADLQEQSNDSVLHFYRQMLHIRRTTPALRSGGFRFERAEDGVLVFSRGDGVTCCFNLSRLPRTVDIGTAGGVLVASDARVAGQGVSLGPLGFAILRNPPEA